MDSLIHMTMTDANAKKILSTCEKVFFTKHAMMRMKERGITRAQVLLCLQRGSIIESPWRTLKGDWQCTLQHCVSGNYLIVVAVIKIIKIGNTRAIIVTAY